MKSYVVDSSVALKWFFEEEHTENALRLLDADTTMYSVDLLFLECNAVICKYVRRKRLAIDRALQHCVAIEQFPITIERAEDYRKLALPYSLECELGLYDAVFLAQACRRGMPLVTADRRFCNSVVARDLPVQVIWVGDL